jgi:hypothetical protein
MARLPERYLNAQTARAITSPSAIVLAGAGAAAAIATGFPALVCVGAGLVAWAARVAFGLPRTPKGDRMDPFTLNEPWRKSVIDAQVAQRRYDTAVRGVPSGPVRDRLAEIGERLEDGVKQVWRIAQRGHLMSKGLKALDVESTKRELVEVERDLRTGQDERLEAARESLRSQLHSAQRMIDAVSDARSQLRLMDARLDEAVTRAIELSLRSPDDADVSGLGSDVESLVQDMEALRAALEDVDRPGGATATA